MKDPIGSRHELNVQSGGRKPKANELVGERHSCDRWALKRSRREAGDLISLSRVAWVADLKWKGVQPGTAPC